MTHLIEDPYCYHVAVWICDYCDGIHVGNFDKDKKQVSQVVISPDSLNAVIIELMKLRNPEESESEEEA